MVSMALSEAEFLEGPAKGQIWGYPTEEPPATIEVSIPPSKNAVRRAGESDVLEVRKMTYQRVTLVGGKAPWGYRILKK